MSTSTRCEAKDPKTCRYHGTSIASEQWLPNYDEASQRLAELNARAASNHNSRTTTQQLEQERQQAILDVYASQTGMKKLVNRIETAQYTETVPDFHSEEKLREALVHRHHLLANTAVNDFETLKEDEFTQSTAERLFASTEAIVIEHDGKTVVSSVKNGQSGVEFTEYDLTNAADRARLVTKRREVEAAAVAREQFGKADLVQGVANTADENVNFTADGSAAVVTKDGVPYLRVEFNQDGTFKRGIASRDTGYSLFIESPTHLRTFVYDVTEGNREVKPIEAYLAA